jgi:hypothetical protein
MSIQLYMKTEFRKLSICFSFHLYSTDARFILDTVLSFRFAYYIEKKKMTIFAL